MNRHAETNRSDTQARLLTVRETAERLGISERTLWAITAPRGNLPAARIGRAVRYDPVDVAAFIEACKNEGVDHA